jgi:hypothetical protein
MTIKTLSLLKLPFIIISLPFLRPKSSPNGPRLRNNPPRPASYASPSQVEVAIAQRDIPKTQQMKEVQYKPNASLSRSRDEERWAKDVGKSSSNTGSKQQWRVGQTSCLLTFRIVTSLIFRLARSAAGRRKRFRLPVLERETFR